ncbi:MAG: class II aldolase/adducin family protein [Burkholderiales bacterium]|nr:class II aldolase/adducin family protein [Burkholderiales bacterium]
MNNKEEQEKKREKTLRKKIIETARSMNRLGINVNKSGNVSARFEEGGQHGFLITPTGIPYKLLRPKDINFTWKIGEKWHHHGPFAPSSEWMLHALIYANRPDIKAIVHTHSRMATALSCRGKPIPAFHPLIATLGGKEIACAEYATMGSEELAEECVKTLGSTMGCLLSHHGVVACGHSLEQALAFAVEIENLASMWIELLKIGGHTLLPDEEMDRILEKFKVHPQNYVR